jgi:dethiobiotin synthase
MSDAYVVYGTDTSVGKTVVAGAIAASWHAEGHKVAMLKPIQTGAGEDDDAATINQLVGATIAQTGLRFQQAVAPSVAAELEGQRIDPGEVIAWTRARILTDGKSLVETAGGCAVEICPGYDMADLGRDLGLPAILVCRAGLGTLNHTVLSVEHLRDRGVAVSGLVVNGTSQDPDIAERTNPTELERLTGVPIVGTLPKLASVQGAILSL